jgi:hypothetical protein
MPCGGLPALGGKPGIPCGGGKGICGGGQGRCAGRPAGRGPEKFMGGGMPGCPEQMYVSECNWKIVYSMYLGRGKVVVLLDHRQSLRLVYHQA